MNLNNNKQEIPEVQIEEYALKLDVKNFSCRSKVTAKLQKKFCRLMSKDSSHWEKIWTDVESRKFFS